MKFVERQAPLKSLALSHSVILSEAKDLCIRAAEKCIGPSLRSG